MSVEEPADGVASIVSFYERVLPQPQADEAATRSTDEIVEEPESANEAATETAEPAKL